MIRPAPTAQIINLYAVPWPRVSRGWGGRPAKRAPPCAVCTCSARLLTRPQFHSHRPPLRRAPAGQTIFVPSQPRRRSLGRPPPRGPPYHAFSSHGGRAPPGPAGPRPGSRGRRSLDAMITPARRLDPCMRPLLPTLPCLWTHVTHPMQHTRMRHTRARTAHARMHTPRTHPRTHACTHRAPARTGMKRRPQAQAPGGRRWRCTRQLPCVAAARALAPPLVPLPCARLRQRDPKHQPCRRALTHYAVPNRAWAAAFGAWQARGRRAQDRRTWHLACPSDMLNQYCTGGNQ
ncbi:MAG: hypothetical protein J3K34DRAFT_402621 [Monoraphidium minutum]|nr:MAG: hypothetical protein J3K34DRAFT_402621 [Monoraphidium minutum]